MAREELDQGLRLTIHRMEKRKEPLIPGRGDSAVILHNAIMIADPEMRNAFTPEEAEKALKKAGFPVNEKKGGQNGRR